MSTFDIATAEGGSPVGARETTTARALRRRATDNPGTVAVFVKAQKAHSSDDSERWEPADVAPTLSAEGGDANSVLIAQDVSFPLTTKSRFTGDQDTLVVVPDVAATLTANGNGRCDPQDNLAVAYQLRSPGSRARAAAIETEVSGALLAAGAKAGAGTTEECVVLSIEGVRRLTPTECERLQGLPDGWTIPYGPSLLDAPAWHELDPEQRAALAVPWDPPTRLDTARRSGCGDAVDAAVSEWVMHRIKAAA